MNFDDVCDFLQQRGIAFDKKDVEHGRQIKTKTGESVIVYDTGSVVVNGKNTPLRQELRAWKDSGFTPVAPTDGLGKAPAAKGPLSNDIFIVYGHDVGARDALELMLRRMELNPIVLANLSASGDTIIEKLEKYLRESGNVGFACVLLTPDDQGHRQGAPEEVKYRARQNVILELGMALSRLGRNRVAILYKETVERPSDIDGLLYLPFEEHVSEVKAVLFRELKDAGYSPDPAAL